LIAVLTAAAATAGCGGGGATLGAEADHAGAAQERRGAACPAAWKAGWQRLANDMGARVYCPTWMPAPLDGQINGRYKNGRWVDRKDNSYLVSFLWVDQDAGVSREVHVNFRGYPGRAKVPTCESVVTANGKTRRSAIPCFSDPRGRRKIAGVRATVYTVNQGIDAWHVLYAWKQNGSLYTVSQHVVAPYTYRQVVHNLDRIVRGLAPIDPTS
jgi:hypothetical protein